MRKLLSLTVLLVAGCTLSPDPDSVRIRSAEPDGRQTGQVSGRLEVAVTDYPIAAIDHGTIDPLLAGLWQYGLLAASAYEPKRKNLNNICDQMSQYTSRWKRNKAFTQDLFPPNRQRGFGLKIPGLGYSVWEDRSARSHKRVAVVFRGTDARQLGDWYSNARWITRLNPLTWDQYQQVRDLIPELVPQLKEKYGGDVEIITVGHSLGGGLAQHAAYSSPDIALVYAFATSPVTGASSLDGRVDPAGVTIFRTYEAGEILALLRWASRKIISLPGKDPRVMEIRFNLRSTFKAGSIGGGPIGQHNIEQLSCDLVCRVENNHSPARCETNPG